MPKSVLEAIELGLWDYEPDHDNRDEFSQTNAMPGSDEKLKVLAERVQQGQPLWHPDDRLSYQETTSE